MAIRKQNRTIWVLATVVFLVIVTFLIREGKLEEFIRPPAAPEATNEKSNGNEEQFGEKVSDLPTPFQAQGQAHFGETLDRLAQCFQIQASETLDQPPLQIESLFQKIQNQFGPVSHQADRWMNWHLRTREGKERRLRLEISETDDGKIRRELHYFNVDRDGLPTPIPLEEAKASNPTDEVMSQMLKEGEVFYKERAAVAFFSNNDRVEYLEKNGELAEIEVFKGDHQFRCSDVKAPETCQCL